MTEVSSEEVSGLPAVDVEHPGTLWLDSAACRKALFTDSGELVPEAVTRFFVEAGHVISDADREMCRTCPVRRECLIHSFVGAEGKMIAAGYFAGFSYGQRKVMPLAELLEIVDAESSRYRSPAR